jgi:hypothetical protein
VPDGSSHLGYETVSLGKYLPRIVVPSFAGSGSVNRIAMWADGLYYVVVDDERSNGQSGWITA